jgi:hypothetical protein
MAAPKIVAKNVNISLEIAGLIFIKYPMDQVKDGTITQNIKARKRIPRDIELTPGDSSKKEINHFIILNNNGAPTRT